jgi:hypothetical protein
MAAQRWQEKLPQFPRGMYVLVQPILSCLFAISAAIFMSNSKFG